MKNYYSAAKVIAPSDTNDLPNGSTGGIYVGGAGDMVVTFVTMKDGESITLKGLQAGEIYPFRVKRIWATGTTATDVVVLY